MSVLLARVCTNYRQFITRAQYINISQSIYHNSSSSNNHNDKKENKSNSDTFFGNFNDEDDEATTAGINNEWIEVPTLECQLSQFDAMESFGEWIKKQWFSPSKIKSNPENYIHVIHKCYVPYWHFSANVLSSFNASVAADRTDRTSHRTSSCMYSSIDKEMQICANDKLTIAEQDFLSIPQGPTQFQRMYHHFEDILPTTLSKREAAVKVREWLKTTENARVTKLVIDEKLFNPLIESQIEIECRKAYMPCFLIYFSSSVVNAESKPNAITDVIPVDANLRVIVNGSCGSVLGPRIYSYINVLKYMSIFTSFTVLPITSLLMYYPVQNAIAISFLTGASLAAISQSPMFSNRVYKLNGDLLNTQHAQYKRQRMEDAEVEEILKGAEKAWSSYQHRARMYTREYERQQKVQTDYHSFADYSGTKYSAKVDDQRPKRRHVRFIELYEVLGIAPNATTKEIQQAFTKLVKMYHPDVLQTFSDKERQEKSETFQKILLAFQVLRDPNRRKVYDETGSTKEIKKKTTDADRGQHRSE